MLPLIGLGLIVLAWLIQLRHSWRGKKEVAPFFIIFYCLGVVLLIADGIIGNALAIASLNALALIGAALVLFKIQKK